MGTVFNQEPRFLEDGRGYIFANACQVVEMAKKISKDNKITYMEALESIKLGYSIMNDDIKDEQIQCMAELFRDLVWTVGDYRIVVKGDETDD